MSIEGNFMKMEERRINIMGIVKNIVEKWKGMVEEDKKREGIFINEVNWIWIRKNMRKIIRSRKDLI